MTKKKILARLLFGLLFITAGIGYIGNLVGFWKGFTIFFPGWWTLFIIIPAVCSFIYDGFRFYNSILLLLGISFLLTTNDVFKFYTMKVILVSAILILIGLRIIFNPVIKKNKFASFKSNKTVYVTGGAKQSATFTEKNINFDNQEFTGIKLEASFASINLDLRKAIINQDVQIEIELNFSGSKIYLPDNVALQIKSDTAFGGVTNKHKTVAPEGSPTVYIYADCSFGGLEIF
ncbi:MAG: hypothetical protein WCQ63_05820 [Methanomethylophilus sp.]